MIRPSRDPESPEPRSSASDQAGYVFASLGMVPHLITSRRGGVSPVPYDSLNLSFAVGDDPRLIVENRRTAFGLLNADLADAVFARQVHGTSVAAVSVADRGRGSDGSVSAVPDTDGLITDSPGVWLALTVADCVPILLYDPVHHAVGLAHAGWRGTIAGVARSAVAAMQGNYGTLPSDLRGGIGPSIGPCCYEVGPEVVASAHRSLPQPELCLSRPTGDDGSSRYHLDLWTANRLVLLESGLSDGNIEIAGLCTYCNRSRFFSHRGDGGRSGRFGAIIGLGGRE